ncbi:MAG: (Fe-S)-binding protein [Nitrospirota bacterium]|nr:MAG: (Fe-S)-binding protein [Nitrospirota bacterium]
MNEEQFHRNIDECIRCGSCKVACPSYDQFRTETSSPRGRIAILNGILKGEIGASGGAISSIFSCIQCGACTSSCPPGINIPEVIYKARALFKPWSLRDTAIRTAVKTALYHPGLAFRASRPFRGLMRSRNLLPDDNSLRQRSSSAQNLIPGLPEKKRGTIALFRGCSTRYIYPDLNDSMIRVLSVLGYDVIVPDTEVCCGTPLRSLGLEKEAKDMALKNMDAYAGLGADKVISACPTCVMALRNEYPHLINDSLSNAVDISTFFIDENINVMGKIDERVLYHDPCHMVYGLKVKDGPRDVLTKLGVKLVDDKNHECCGFGGTYSLSFRNASLEQASRRGHSINMTDAEVVYTSCPGCILQLRKTVRTKRVLHLVQAIEKALLN